MANSSPRDANRVPALGGASAIDGTFIAPFVDPTSKRLYVTGGDASALTPLFAVINATTIGDNTLITGISGKQIRVLNGLLIGAGAVNLYFRDGTAGTAITGTINIAANGGFQIPYSPIGNFQTSSSNALVVNLSSGVAIGGWLTYVTL